MARVLGDPRNTEREGRPLLGIRRSWGGMTMPCGQLREGCRARSNSLTNTRPALGAGPRRLTPGVSLCRTREHLKPTPRPQWRRLSASGRKHPSHGALTVLNQIARLRLELSAGDDGAVNVHIALHL